MKVLVMPDIHGSWANALAHIKKFKDEVDYVVTLGDYVDDWDDEANGQPMIDGFNELISMARAEPEKFRICTGNHDLSYYSNSREGHCCSGHKPEFAEQYRKMFEDNLDILHACVLIDGILFSHAGVSQFWYNKTVSNYNMAHAFDKCPKKIIERFELNKAKLMDINHYFFDDEVFTLVNVEDEEGQKKVDKYREIQAQLYDEAQEIDKEMQKYKKDAIRSYVFYPERLDKMFRENPSLLDHCGWESSGNSSGESCVWIRPDSLLRDIWPSGLKCQIVGHTEIAPFFKTYNRHKLAVIDNRGHNMPLIIDTETFVNEHEFEKLGPRKIKNLSPELKKLMMIFGGL